MNHVHLTIDDEEIQNIRVDSYLADHAGILPRNQLKNRAETIIVNQKEAKLSKHVSCGDVIEVYLTAAPESSYAPENIPLTILFENDVCIVVDKPRGMVVHPAAGNSHGTLVQALMYHCKELRELQREESIRPGIVHRLDKDTSGVIIAGKNAESQEYLASQFRKRRTIKKYYAVAKGDIYPTSGIIDLNIRRDPRHRKKFTTAEEGGKTAETGYRVLARRNGFSFVALSPRTGRTHQLRVHMQSLGTPILGDPLYARRDPKHPNASLMLHAYSLTISLPPDRETCTFRAPLPEDFRRMWLEIVSPAGA